jgi:diaminopimelate decarboxylase
MKTFLFLNTFLFQVHDRDKAIVTITGPLCFSGDILAKDIDLFAVSHGDRILVRNYDNFITLHSIFY